jgi:uncharacterized repeat protein (TIGR03806 family)
MRTQRYFAGGALGSVLLVGLLTDCGGELSGRFRFQGGAAGAGASGAGDAGDAGDAGEGAGAGAGGTAGAAPAVPPTRPANASCLAFGRQPSTVPATWERVFAGTPSTPSNTVSLVGPMLLAQKPGDGSRFYVAQRGGSVVTFPAQGASDATKTVALTVPRPVSGLGEGGLLGLAFHPKFAENGYVFFSYTQVDDTPTNPSKMASVVARMQSFDGGLTFDPASYTEILGPFAQPFTNHNGGDAHFGNDGFLYLSFGDGGSGADPLNYGQNKNVFFAKILRIDVDHPPPGAPPGRLYGIPPSNPFAAGGGEPATFAYGFRNPFRFSVDRATGELWVGDVGQNRYEEVDAKIKLGGNYGWRFREAAHCFNPGANCPTAGLIDPVWEYDRTVGKSITGGVVYRGKAMPSLVGSYIFGDFVSGSLWALRPDAEGKLVQEALSVPGSDWVAFNEDVDGEVYAVSIKGSIFKLVPAAVEPPSPLPAALSLTGCADVLDPKLPATGLVPYGVRSELWSDGAEKERYFAIPDGAKITVNPDGDLDLPVGSVVVKTFKVGGKRVETRLMVRHDDGGWAGYTYEWSDDERDATLLPSSKVKSLAGGQPWYFPSRADCLACHTVAAGRTLGLELAQLNGEFTYPNGYRGNQLEVLERMGLFDQPIGDPAARPALPVPHDEGDLGARARSYLHANCSNCHRPESTGAAIDLRFTTPLGDTKACDAAAQNGDLGIDDAKIIDPGSPATSLLVARPERLDANRMPPLASSAVDEQGVALLTQWIEGLTSCPEAGGGAGAGGAAGASGAAGAGGTPP